MTLFLHDYNIVRVINGDKIVNCTVIKMCFDYAVIKYQGSEYKIPYSMIDQVIGHELLMTAQ